MSQLEKKLRKKYEGCNLCDLHKYICQYVFYRGESPCEILFVGEAPGFSEDATGKPFIGRAGELLEELIEETAEITTHFTYGITNVVCCIPTEKDELGNQKIRQPTKVEAKSCQERLLYTINQCKPKVVVPVGRVAETHLPLNQMPSGLVIQPIQHTAYILRKGGSNSIDYQRNLITMVELVESMQEAHHDKEKKKAKAKKKTFVEA